MRREFDIDFRVAARAGDLSEKIRRFAVMGDESLPLEQLVAQAEAIVEETRPGPSRARWELWLAAARCSLAEGALSDTVRTGAGVADAKARLEILQQTLGEMAAKADRSNHGDGYKVVVNRVLEDPLPVLYWARDRTWDRFRSSMPDPDGADHEDVPEALPAVARVVVYLDDGPLVSPQELRPATLYKIRLEAHFAAWSNRVASVDFRLATTLATSQYSLSALTVTGITHVDDARHTVNAEGTIAFQFAQNDPFSPIAFALSAFLVVGGEHVSIRIVGHDQLHFRVRDPSRTLLSSGWPRMDAHVHELLQKLCDEQPAIHDELNVLIPLFDALTAILGTFAQGGVLKGSTHVSEADFQHEALKLMRMKLGQDVQEGPKQAGGITDIRYRGAIVELKVEDSIPDRQQLLAKYGSQATQYQGVEGRSVATVLVLDLTEKTDPPGDLREDVLLTRVKTQGASGAFPSWAVLFVVRGNVRSPSDYSR
jgi:hypothetical protein